MSRQQDQEDPLTRRVSVSDSYLETPHRRDGCSVDAPEPSLRDLQQENDSLREAVDMAVEAHRQAESEVNSLRVTVHNDAAFYDSVQSVLRGLATRWAASESILPAKYFAAELLAHLRNTDVADARSPATSRVDGGDRDPQSSSSESS